MPSPLNTRLAEVGQAILDARADQLAADLAGDTKRADEHTDLMNRALEFWGAVKHGQIKVNGEAR